MSKTANIRNLDIVRYANSIRDTQKYHPSIVGEFSGAITDCAKWLNGVGTGSRYDDTFDESQLVRNSPPPEESTIEIKQSTKSCSDVLTFDRFSEQHKKDIREYIEVQIVEYENKSSGWIFWNYKTENAIEWSFKLLNEHDLFPKDLKEFKYYTSGSEFILENSSTKPKLFIFSIVLSILSLII